MSGRLPWPEPSFEAGNQSLHRHAPRRLEENHLRAPESLKEDIPGLVQLRGDHQFRGTHRCFQPLGRLGEKAGGHDEVQREGQGLFQRMEVVDPGSLAQLQHAPQHGDSRARSLDRYQQLQGGPEALRVGVVAVHQEGQAAQGSDLTPHPSSLDPANATGGICRRNPQSVRYRESQQGVGPSAGRASGAGRVPLSTGTHSIPAP